MVDTIRQYQGVFVGVGVGSGTLTHCEVPLPNFEVPFLHRWVDWNFIPPTGPSRPTWGTLEFPGMYLRPSSPSPSDLFPSYPIHPGRHRHSYPPWRFPQGLRPSLYRRGVSTVFPGPIVTRLWRSLRLGV